MKSDKALFYTRLEKVLIHAIASFATVTAVSMFIIYLIDLAGMRPSFLGYGTAYIWAFIGMLIHCQGVVSEIFEYEKTTPRNTRTYVDTDFELQDDKYPEAKDLVIKTGRVSTAFLMRELGVSYSRARILIDMLEDDRVVEVGGGTEERVQKVIKAT